MRIAFVSDIHGNLPALEAVVADMARRGVDRVVNLGDSLSGPLLPEETAQCLMAQDWLHLAGNHERQLLDRPVERMNASDAHARARLSPRTLHWVATLAHTHRLDADVWLCHGSPRSDLEYLLETVTPEGLRLARAEEIAERRGHTPARLIACGHSHLPRALRAADGCLLLNPGSVGLPGYDDDHPHCTGWTTAAPMHVMPSPSVPPTGTGGPNCWPCPTTMRRWQHWRGATSAKTGPCRWPRVTRCVPPATSKCEARR